MIPGSGHRRATLTVAPLLVLAACATAPSGPRIETVSPPMRASALGSATAPSRPPMQPSADATAAQLALAREQGYTVGAELQLAVAEEGAATGTMPAGPYVVTYIISPPAAYYEAEALPGRLTLHDEVAPGLAHLGVIVRDAADGRIVPGLRIGAWINGTGTLLPFGWHPVMNRYGENVQIPTTPFALRIVIEPAPFGRHDRVNGERYAENVTAEFANVSVPATAMQRAARRLAASAPSAELRLSREEGAATGRALREMLAQDASGMTRRAEDYDVSVAVRSPAGLWEPRPGALQWTPAPANGTHLEVVVRDTATGLPLPGLDMRATVFDARGHQLTTAPVPFLWHPWLDHYGANLQLPRNRRYTVRLHIERPTFRRYAVTETAREQFVRSVDVDFANVVVP